MKNKTKKFENITQKLNDMGLTLDTKTGGYFIPNNDFYVKTSGWEQSPSIKGNKTKEVKLLPYNIFLKSLLETEKSFKLKLFVNN